MPSTSLPVAPSTVVVDDAEPLVDGWRQCRCGGGVLCIAATRTRSGRWTDARHAARVACRRAGRDRDRDRLTRRASQAGFLHSARNEALSPICPTCGCSLIRLEISREDATRIEHDGREVLFCCQGCADLFAENPDQYLDEIRDWIVCPTCLAEKPEHLTVSITHEGQQVHFCRCPCCLDEFRKRPAELLGRLSL